MMLFKLSVRNIRRSIQNYLIYFATIIIGVAIFYVFNSIGEQSVMLKMSDSVYEIIQMMMKTLSVVSVFVSVVFGFLIVYASTFMMKRRKKEFGIYMLLGMSKQRIAAIMLIETVLIGVISLTVGLALGVCVSQGMSVIVANMFEQDMTSFRFIVSVQAIVKTIIYFAVMYVVVMCLDVFIVGKTRLISLLNAGRRSERNHAKNKFVCVIVFVIACVLLGTAYYNVTAGLREIKDLEDIVVQIIKGIIGTFMLFWSLSGMLVTLAKQSKRFYYRKLNCFSVKELSSRINTTVFSGSIICLLLFFTICILSSSVAIRNAQNKMLKDNTPCDVNIYNFKYDEIPVTDEEYDLKRLLDDSDFDYSLFEDYEIVHILKASWENGKENAVTFYDVMGERVKKLAEEYSESYVEEYIKNANIGIMSLSDYNKLAGIYEYDRLELAEDEYAVIANMESAVDAYNGSLSDGKIVNVHGKSLKPGSDRCIEGAVAISTFYENDGVLIVPDSVITDDMISYNDIFVANYVSSDDSELEAAELYIREAVEDIDESSYNENEIRSYLYTSTSKGCKDNALGTTAMIVFLGSYLGIVFLISGAAILSLKELSQATDNKEKYVALRRIGVDESMINKSLFSQSLFFFGLPLAIAIVHSIFGMQTAQFILTTYGKEGLLGSIIMAAATILGIYGLYFLITYFCSKKIISE